jgi:radical SAM protein with 4Fe4S-binding SPASM domain
MATTFLLRNLFYNLSEAALWMRDLHSYNPRARRTSLHGPAKVQIQTIDRCNAACIMCPYSSSVKTAAANPMDDALYLKILKDLRHTGTVRDVLLMLQNEPLLDKKLPDRVRLVKELIGRHVHTGTVTNGAPLTPLAIDRLSASGIDYVSVSIDAIREGTFARIRHGLDYEHVVGNTLSLSKRLGSSRVSVRFLRQRENDGEEEAFAQYWRRRGIRVVFMEPTNRAGLVQSYEKIKKHRPVLWKKLIYPLLNRCVPACPLPFSRMSILSDGRVVLCCNDWGPHDIVGDLSQQTLREVWNSEKFNHYRHLLWTHKTKDSLVCADCSLSGHYWKI